MVALETLVGPLELVETLSPRGPIIEDYTDPNPESVSTADVVVITTVKRWIQKHAMILISKKERIKKERSVEKTMAPSKTLKVNRAVLFLPFRLN
ncbi:hypothetical protein F2Q70_00028613 [Brassica cretica]|uniref:Uncharacterized protein n=1 Tax=Brassica cretica TaxID=69181 RepID=A0A8S9LHG7_BRACR|nr:hypothetical protein F2Q70_00028613 [Brassica cretica]